MAPLSLRGTPDFLALEADHFGVTLGLAERGLQPGGLGSPSLTGPAERAPGHLRVALDRKSVV